MEESGCYIDGSGWGSVRVEGERRFGSLRSVVCLVVSLALLLASGACSDDAGGGHSDGPVRTDASDGGDVGPDGGSDAGPSARELEIEGLSGEVTVDFDRLGVPHIRCQTNADCITAQGYIHAKHRFFEMDLIRRQTLGQLSSIIGAISSILQSDKRFRQLMTTRKGKRLEKAYVEAASPETKAMFEAYAKGVNAWLADVEAGEAELTEEYESPLIKSDEIRKWKPTDTVALYLRLAEQLGQSATGDLGRASKFDALDAEVAADLFGPHPAIDSTIMGEAQPSSPGSLGGRRRGVSLPTGDLRELANRLEPAQGVIDSALSRLRSGFDLIGRGDRLGGSNNWVVGPSQAKSDAALLANDPHLSLNNPAIWYFVELDSKTQGQGDLHVAGASIPAVPGVIAGHNENVAWGVTTARMDLADAYIEELTKNGEAVKYNGKEVPLIEKTYEFDVRGQSAPETATFEFVPHHGAVIAKNTDAGRAVSIKWVAQNAKNNLDFLPAIMRANSVEEFRRALGPARAINQNWVVADRDGSIGWFPAGDIPERPWASTETPNWLPLPGDGSAEWQGFVDDSEHPKMVDPPAGMIATANNDFDGSYADGDPTNDGHTPWQRPPTDGHRHARIVERLEQDAGEHTKETMVDTQADTHSLHGENLVPPLLTAAKARRSELSEGGKAVVDVLDQWEYSCPTGMDGTDPGEATKVDDAEAAAESIGCAAFHVMLPYLTEAVFGDELRPLSGFDPLASWYRLQTPLLRLFIAPKELKRGEEYFDIQTTNTDETKADVVQSVVEKTADKLETVFGSAKPDDWRWGKIHTVTFRSLFAQAGVSQFNVGPYINDGGFWTVDVANPHGRSGDFDDNFGHPNGPSMRAVYRVRDSGVDAWFQLPGGQDHHRESQWYGSLIDEWLTNTPRKLRFGPSEMSGHVEKRFELKPSN